MPEKSLCFMCKWKSVCEVNPQLQGMLPVPCLHPILFSIPSPLPSAWYGLASNSEYSRWQQVAAPLRKLVRSSLLSLAEWRHWFFFLRDLVHLHLSALLSDKETLHFAEAQHSRLEIREGTGPEPELTQQGAAEMSWQIFLGVHELLSNSLDPHL